MWALKFTTAALFCWPLAAAQEQQVLLKHQHQNRAQPVNIAVIGAGAAGASTAFHLSKFAAAQKIPVNITVFERNSYIGGRSTTVQAYDDPRFPVELGASIFVQVNSILVDAVREFNLSTSGFRSETADIPGASLGIWDGESFVFTQTGGVGGWWDVAKLLWKYGIAPVRTMRLMKATVGRFLNMYEAPVFPFKSLTEAAQTVGLLAVTAATGEQYMREHGITGNFGRDIVQASTRVNYAQNLAYIHGLEAMVCMATDGAMAVEGGNWQIFASMIRASNATALLQTAVTEIRQQEDSSYTLDFQTVMAADTTEGYPNPKSQRFDSVVLAAPYQFADLSITSPAGEAAHKPDEVPYVALHVTLFTSPHLLSPAFFNLPADTPAPRVVLTTLPPNERPRRGPEDVAGKPGFFSISLLQVVTNPATAQREYLYKIFSPQPPCAEFLSSLLGVPTPTAAGGSRTANEDESSSSDNSAPDANADAALVRARVVTWLHRKLWHSYPYEFPRVTFEDVQPGGSGSGSGDGWYYTGGMDSFISTMETNALMGRNVAALLVAEWQSRRQGLPAALGESAAVPAPEE